LNSIIPVEYTLHNVPDAWIDDYFYARYVDHIRPVVIAQLQNAVKQFPDYLFVFTGHSLGAALSTIAAHDMILSGYAP